MAKDNKSEEPASARSGSRLRLAPPKTCVRHKPSAAPKARLGTAKAAG